MSREKQIEEMLVVVRNNTEACKTCTWYKEGLCMEDCELEEDNQKICTDLFDAGYRKQEWISVEDRLPERNGRYLTHCNIEGQSFVCILYYSKVGGFNEGTVTHWMPLLEAPKMKGGAE